MYASKGRVAVRLQVQQRFVPFQMPTVYSVKVVRLATTKAWLYNQARVTACWPPVVGARGWAILMK
jgi:hypothetical protein